MKKRLLYVSALALSASVAGGFVAIGTAKDIPLATSISEQDKASGAKAHPELLKEFGGAYAGPQADYAIRVGRKIASQSSLSKQQGDFTVTLLNSPVNNAFAIPGGYIYITRQLMALCNDEAEMAGVLGHEVGHVAAMHGQRRQKAATKAAVGGLLLQVLTGAVLGNSGLGGLLQQGIGTGTQLLTLKFSRAQEDEADDLGVRYLASAGYDPHALSSMLGSLAAQSALDAQVTGRNSTIPAWASTHPDPAKRVVRTLGIADASKSKSTLRNRDIFLNSVNGMLYGDDPDQGVIENGRFLHPKLALAFTAPAGFGMSNGTDAVTISGSGGQAQFSAAAYAGNLDAYVSSIFAAIANGGRTTAVTPQRTMVNGLPAAYATLQANTDNGQVDVTVFAYEMSPKSAFHFVMMTPAGQGIGPFTPMVQSYARLSAKEAAAIKPRKVSVVKVAQGDTIASLSNRMAYGDLQQQRFLTLNGLQAGGRLTPGQRVKLITY